MTDEQRGVILAALASNRNRKEQLREMDLKLQQEMHEVQRNIDLLRSLFPVVDLEADNAAHFGELRQS